MSAHPSPFPDPASRVPSPLRGFRLFDRSRLAKESLFACARVHPIDRTRRPIGVRPGRPHASTRARSPSFVGSVSTPSFASFVVRSAPRVPRASSSVAPHRSSCLAAPGAQPCAISRAARLDRRARKRSPVPSSASRRRPSRSPTRPNTDSRCRSTRGRTTARLARTITRACAEGIKCTRRCARRVTR